MLSRILPISWLGKPVQQLNELQLIVKIMLKPQHHFFKFAEIFQHAVTLGKIGAKSFIAFPAEISQRACANI